MAHSTSFDNASVIQQVNANRNQSDHVTVSESLVGIDSARQAIDSAVGQQSDQPEIINPYLTNELIQPEGVDEALVQGIDIDSMTGIDVNGSVYANDAIMTNDQILSATNEIMNGYIAGRHWTQFAESNYDLIDQYLGLGLEAYECASAGITNAWNAKENQLCEGAGECNDLNNDGKVGNASGSDKCDGENTTLTDWLLEQAVEAGEEALKFFGFGSDEEDDDTEADPDECFEKPWLYDRFNLMGSSIQFQDQGASELISMNVITRSQNMFAFDL